MKISTLAGNEVTLDVRVGDGPEDVVQVVYRPGNLTLEFADKIRGVREDGFDMDIALYMFEQLLVSWDLENEDGTQLGVAPEEIKKVPIAFLGRLLAAMEAESRPNPSRGGTSGEDSPQEQDPSQAGTSSDVQPDSGESRRGSFSPDPLPG